MTKNTGPQSQDELVAYNEKAWDQQVRSRNQWTVPCSADDIAEARKGNLKIVLTPHKLVPQDWLPDFQSREYSVLCLAGSGGQQAPILAAAGARVTVLDLSTEQLKQDQLVAERESLTINTVQGDMRDLSVFADDQFDFIVHPCSNGFVPDVQPVWNEAARVLKPGGELISGFVQPIFYLFDFDAMEKGTLKVAHAIPYSDLTSIPDEKRQAFIDAGEPLCFGHSLTDQIGGQIEAGLAIVGFYEDIWEGYVISDFIPSMAATRARLIAT